MGKKNEMLQVVYVNIDELKPSEMNPRSATKEERQRVKESIEKYGLVDPLIVNFAENRKNIIIGGHLRWEIAREMGLEKVPVVYVDIPDIEQEKELLLRLNRNTGHWDNKLLRNFDANFLRNIGFKPGEITNIFQSLTVKSLFTSKTFEKIQYEPQLDREVQISELYDDTLTKELVNEINRANISQEVKNFLIIAAQRFTKLNFDMTAEYYAQTKNAEVKELFEKLALVIVDYNDALQMGWAKMIGRLVDEQKEYT